MPATGPPGSNWRMARGATAELIAASTVFLSRDPRLAHVLPTGAAALSERFLNAAAPTRLRLVRQLARPGLRGVVNAAERAILPGIQLHYAARKRFIEDAVRTFLSTGGARVVVLGAGLDTLATRLAGEHLGVDFVEIDHPGVQDRKRRGLADVGADYLSLHPADLAGGGLPGVKPGTATFFVLEGVTMYLDEAAVAATLGASAEAGGPGSRIAWTFLAPDERGRIGFRRSRRSLVDAWLRIRREPFTWGIDAARIPAFVEPLGLRAVQIVGTEELRARYLAPAGIADPPAEGEEICVCEVTDA
jgi:methyltransferase (TIGR00027 family)